MAIITASLGFDSRVRSLDQCSERVCVDLPVRAELHVTHVLSGSLEQSGWIGEMRAEEEAHVDVRCERIDVAESCVACARGGMAVVEKLAHIVAALSHSVEPGARKRGERTGTFVEPGVNRRVSLDRGRKAQQRT
ncbi:MAG TPA: hypothetical protein VJ690_10905 [Burkholderiales bacterium]|nr:hypothetical protein [Burkholderiales bacterium]